MCIAIHQYHQELLFWKESSLADTLYCLGRNEPHGTCHITYDHSKEDGGSSSPFGVDEVEESSDGSKEDYGGARDRFADGALELTTLRPMVDLDSLTSDTSTEEFEDVIEPPGIGLEVNSSLEGEEKKDQQGTSKSLVDEDDHLLFEMSPFEMEHEFERTDATSSHSVPDENDAGSHSPSDWKLPEHEEHKDLFTFPDTGDDAEDYDGDEDFGSGDDSNFDEEDSVVTPKVSTPKVSTPTVEVDVLDYIPSDYDYLNYTTDDHYPTLYGGKMTTGRSRKKNDTLSSPVSITTTTTGSSSLEETVESENILPEDFESELHSKIDNEKEIDQDSVVHSLFSIDAYDDYEYLDLDNETDYDLTYFPDPIVVTSSSTEEENIDDSQIELNEKLEKKKIDLQKRLQDLEKLERQLREKEKNLTTIYRDETENELEKTSIDTAKHGKEFLGEMYEEEKEISDYEEMDFEDGSGSDSSLRTIDELMDDFNGTELEAHEHGISITDENLISAENDEDLESSNVVEDELDRIKNELNNIENEKAEIHLALINLDNEKLDEEVDKLHEIEEGEEELEKEVAETRKIVEFDKEELDIKEKDIFDQESMLGVLKNDTGEDILEVEEQRIEVYEREKALQEEEEALEEEQMVLLGKEAKLEQQEKNIEEAIEQIEKERDRVIDREISIAIQETDLEARKNELEIKEETLGAKESDMQNTLQELEEKARELDREIAMIDKDQEQLFEERLKLEDDEMILEEEELVLAGQEEDVETTLDEIDVQEENLMREKVNIDNELNEIKDALESVDALENGIRFRNESLKHEEEILKERDEVIDSMRKGTSAAENELLSVREDLDDEEELLIGERVELAEIEEAVDEKLKDISEIENSLIDEEKMLEREQHPYTSAEESSEDGPVDEKVSDRSTELPSILIIDEEEEEEEGTDSEEGIGSERVWEDNLEEYEEEYGIKTEEEIISTVEPGVLGVDYIDREGEDDNIDDKMTSTGNNIVGSDVDDLDTAVDAGGKEQDTDDEDVEDVDDVGSDVGGTEDDDDLREIAGGEGDDEPTFVSVDPEITWPDGHEKPTLPAIISYEMEGTGDPTVGAVQEQDYNPFMATWFVIAIIVAVTMMLVICFSMWAYHHRMSRIAELRTKLYEGYQPPAAAAAGAVAAGDVEAGAGDEEEPMTAQAQRQQMAAMMTRQETIQSVDSFASHDDDFAEYGDESMG
ncbi:hypothetical protein FHG87_011965 [Trinorchestia longiramus]|nr:hypothetical protein FHG87_011965 [Trinorchestia longiramus]